MNDKAIISIFADNSASVRNLHTMQISGNVLLHAQDYCHQMNSTPCVTKVVSESHLLFLGVIFGGAFIEKSKNQNEQCSFQQLFVAMFENCNGGN